MEFWNDEIFLFKKPYGTPSLQHTTTRTFFQYKRGLLYKLVEVVSFTIIICCLSSQLKITLDGNKYFQILYYQTSYKRN